MANNPLSFNIDPGTSAEDLAARRQLAYSLMQQGGSGDPIRSPWQGVNRIAQSLVGGYDAYKIDQSQKDQKTAAAKLLGEAFGAPATPAPGVPALPGAAPAAPAAPLPATPAQGAFSAAGRDYAPPTAPVPTGALDLIKKEEGFAPTAAWDKRQFSSGYGTKAGAAGEPITEEEANRRLLAETAPLNAWISRNVKVPLTDDQRNSLMSFGHNLGAGALGKLLPDLNAGNFAAVAQRMPTFNNVLNEDTGKLEPDAAILARRQREAAPFAAQAAPGGAPAVAGAPAAPGTPGPLGGDPATAALIQKLALNPYTAPMANKLMEMTMQRNADLATPVLSDIGYDMYGNPIKGMVDKRTNTGTPLTIAGAPGGTGFGAGAQGLTGQEAYDYYAKANPMIADRAKAIISGREEMPTATKGDHTALMVQQAVREIDPTYNKNRYAFRQKWEDPNHFVGRSKVANEAAIGHMGELDKMIDDLPDTAGLGPLDNLANATRNSLSRGANSELLNKWHSAALLLSGELVKAATGAEGSEGDRKAYLNTLDPNLGTQALKAQLAQYTHLLGSKTRGLINDRKQNMGPFAEDVNISPEAQDTIKQLESRYLAGAQQPHGPGAAPVISAPPPPSAPAVAALQANRSKPEIVAQFVQKYGKDAAQAALAAGGAPAAAGQPPQPVAPPAPMVWPRGGMAPRPVAPTGPMAWPRGGGG